MAYPGNTSGSLAEVIIGDSPNYSLSAGGTETAYTLTVRPEPVAGDIIKIRVSGTTAGNANNKTIQVTLEGSSTTSVSNTVTSAPNGLDFIYDLEVLVVSSSSVSYAAELKFNGVASEVIVNTSPNNVLGSVRLDVDITGTSASDVTINDVVMWVVKQSS